MCFLRARAGEQLVDRLAQAGEDVGAAARGDARDVAQDALAVGGALQAHDRARRAVEHDHRDLVGGRQRLGGGARGLLRQVHLGARHRARLVDHQRQRQRRLLAAVGDVEPDRQHRLEARRHVAARAEALGAARDQQAAALRDEALQRGQRRIGQQRARDVGERDQIVAAEVEVAGQAAGGAHVGGDVLGASARANEPAAPALPSRTEDARIVLGRDRQHALVVLGVAIAPSRMTRRVQRGGPGLGDAHVNAAVVAPGASASVCSGSSMTTCGSPAPSRRTRASVARSASRWTSTRNGARARTSSGASGRRRRRRRLVGGRGERVQRRAAIAQTLGGRTRIAARRDAVRDQQEARDRGGVDQARAEPDREGEIGRGAGRRREAGDRRRGASSQRDLLGARGEADHARRRVAPASAARGRARRPPRRANASAPSETLSETSTSTTAETARAGRRSVGPASAARDAGEHQRAQQRLQRAAGGRKVRERRRRDRESSGAASSSEQPERVLEGERAVAAPRARSRRPPAVVADPLDHAARTRAAARARPGGRRRATPADRAAPACVRPAPAPRPASCRTRARRPGWRRRLRSPTRWKPTCAIAISGRSSRGRALAPVSRAGGASTAASASRPAPRRARWRSAAGTRAASAGRSAAGRSWWRRCAGPGARARSAAARRTIRRPRRRRAPAPAGAPRRC